MFERFDERAIKGVISGQEEARRMGYSEAHPDHLLLGLLAEGTGISAGVLEAQGLNLTATRSRIMDMIGRGSGSEPSQVEFTPATADILKQAYALAVDEKTNVATEHILAALIQAEIAEASDVFERLGLDPKNIRNHLTQAIEHKRAEAQDRNSEIHRKPSPQQKGRKNAIRNIVARDSFRAVFLAEIDNLINYSLSLPDALFMIVNIVGKALEVSRALIVHKQTENNEVTYYEYFDVDRVKSIRTFLSTHESHVIGLLLNTAWVVQVFDQGQFDTTDPLQAELSEFGIKSQIGVPLLTNEATVFGCLIAQQCDERQQWSEWEVDFFYKVSERIAQAIAQKHHVDH